jgi:hypothetical protein
MLIEMIAQAVAAARVLNSGGEGVNGEYRKPTGGAEARRSAEDFLVFDLQDQRQKKEKTSAFLCVSASPVGLRS